MIDPLLGVTIPDATAAPGRHSLAGTGEKILLALQVYDNVGSQTNIAAICRLSAEQSGVRLIGVEGAEGEVRSDPSRGTVRDLIAEGSRISAGVIHLLGQAPDLIDVVGVDDLDANRRSQEAMVRVMSQAGLRDRAFESVRELLTAAQRRVYGQRLAELRAGMLSVNMARSSVSDQTALLTAEAERLGVSLAPFPLVRRFREINVTEQRIDAPRAQKELAIFVNRVLSRLFGWFKVSGNRVDIDFKQAQPVFEFWAESTGVTQEEFERNIKLRGAEKVLIECKEWLEGWLAAGATEHAAAGDAAAHVYYEKLMRLALRLEVPFFELRNFRQFVAMRRDTDALRVGLVDEVKVATQALLESTAGDAGELRRVEEELDLLWRGLRLEVQPGEAEVASIGPGRLRPLINDLERLSGSSFRGGAADVETVDRVAADSAAFLDLSRRRSRHMARRTVELLRDRGEERAILVAGGFHSRAITREFEEDRSVAWSVVSATPDLSELKR